MRTIHYAPGPDAEQAACSRALECLRPAEYTADPAGVSCGQCIRSRAYQAATAPAEALTLDQLRAQLSAAAERDTAAERAYLAAGREYHQAREAYRRAADAVEAAEQAAAFNDANPQLFA